MEEIKLFIDKDIIQNMKELGNGDDEFSERLLIVQLITIYLQNLTERVNEIKNAVINKDAKNIEFSAHTLKSSSRLIGLIMLAEYCQTLEDIGASGDLKSCDDVFFKIENASKQAFTVLQNTINELENELND